MTARKPRAPKRTRSRATRVRTAPLRSAQGEVVIEEIRSLRKEIERATLKRQPGRWNPDPDEVRKSVAKLVLTLVEFIRKLMERQAIRRMEAETLTPREIEDVGVALMTLEETIGEMCKTFGLDPEELNLDLGPLGRLM